MDNSKDRGRMSPRLHERIAMRVLEAFLRNIKKGQLEIVFPDSKRRIYGIADASHRATIQLRNYGLFWRTVRDGGIGLGESYVDGDWEADNLPEAISIILENMELDSERSVNVLWPFRLYHRFRHAKRANSLTGSRANIQEHYDLGNKFFSEILDPTMTYSSALFRSADESLEAAQINKLRSIIDKAMITSSDHVLEIGSGWGSFAILAAKERGCRVTTLTLSEEQHRLVQEKIRKEGLQEQVEVKLCDYRHVTGTYDKIVSIEMMEAIGKQYLGTFFECCERLLKPDGLMVVQVITMLDFWYEEYCKRTDWIQKYIFPGSHLPSLTALSEAIAYKSRFVIERLENIAPHYAHTLALWREKLAEKQEKLCTLGYDDRFQRIFNFYLASCEAEFGTRLLNLLQIVLTRANNEKLLKMDESHFAEQAGLRLVASA